MSTKDNPKSSFRIGKFFGKTEVALIALAMFVLTVAGYHFATTHAKRILILAIVALVLICLGWFFWRKVAQSKIANLYRVIFPAALLVMTVTNCLFFPAGTVPDESYHFWRSYQYAITLSGGDSNTIRAEDLDLTGNDGLLTTTIGKESWGYASDHIGDAAAQGSVSLDGRDVLGSCVTDSANLITSLPQQKLPSAIGILLAWALGLNHVLLFYLGRLFNGLFSALLIIFAVRIIPKGKNIMMAVSLIPMSLHLLGSYSYDGPTIGLAFLLTALIVRAITRKTQISMSEMVGICVVSALLAPCKVVYSVISFLVFFIPGKRFSSKVQEWIFKFATVLVAALSLLVIRLSSLSDLVGSSSELDTRGSEEGHFYTLSGILLHPLKSLAMFYGSLETMGYFWLSNTVGAKLGWFQPETGFSELVPPALLSLLALSTVRSADDNAIMPGGFRIVAIILCLVGSLGVIFSMWTGWTFDTENLILGVQGRYFIPLLVPFLLAIRPKGVRIEYNVGFVLLATLVCFDLANLMHISATAI